MAKQLNKLIRSGTLGHRLLLRLIRFVRAQLWNMDLVLSTVDCGQSTTDRPDGAYRRSSVLQMGGCINLINLSNNGIL